ncbi:MAG: CPBP family intramembrane metalloprotease [Candidatus Krumholzibacteria bacterium]|nr:CPBP family intramembrane metalloprotease [Candidatus Krumholzibacteria bacterium]
MPKILSRFLKSDEAKKRARRITLFALLLVAVVDWWIVIEDGASNARVITGIVASATLALEMFYPTRRRLLRRKRPGEIRSGGSERAGFGMSLPRKKILVFLVLTFGFSSIFLHPIISSGSLGKHVIGLMWCPGVAAIITQLFFHRSLRGLGWKPGRGRYILWAYALPVIYGIALYGITWLTGLGRFVPDQILQWAAERWHIQFASASMNVGIYAFAMATAGVLFSCLPALGEEIGWRGFLVPELIKVTSFARTALISGGIWAVWHYPAVFFADYGNPATPLWFNVIFFTAGVLGISFAMAWLRLRSGSLWPAVVLHASHNLFIQGIFTPLTADTGITAWVIGEFGAGLAILLALTAWLFWRMRAEPAGH